MYDVSNKFKEHVKNNGYIEKSARKAVDEVARIKWSDFVLEPSKPNLIKNGWDDFEPCGSGKNHLEDSPFFEDWTLVQGTEATFKQDVHFEEVDVQNATRIKTVKGRGQGQIRTAFEQGDYRMSMFVKNLSDERMFVRAGVPVMYEFVEAGEFLELKGFYENAHQIEFGGDHDLDFIAWNPLIYKEGDKPLTVIKTPLGNGLTRIQTWGGGSAVQLLLTVGALGLDELRDFTFSTYVENKGPEFEIWLPSGASKSINVTEGYKGFAPVFDENERGGTWLVRIRPKEIGGHVDFVASDPQLVEGDKANPVLIVTPLDDGREHVRVFGATPETKLVHKSTKGFAGEPYTLSTEIENEGLQLQMDTNLSEQSETIRKGDNKINIEGNLEGNNIEIKLGTE